MNFRSIISYLFYLVILPSSLLFAAEANFSAATDGCGEDETGTVTINFSEAAYGTLTYNIDGGSTANAYGTSYYDYNLSSSTINLSGQTSYDLNLSINNDTRYENPETVNQQIIETVEQLYSNLVNIHEQLGYDKNTIKFINSISEKIALIFSNLKMDKALEFLIQFDSDNKNNYIKYLK